MAKKTEQRRKLTDTKHKLWCLCLAPDAPNPPYLLLENRYPRQTLATVAKVNGWNHKVIKTKGAQLGFMFDGVLTAERLKQALDDFAVYIATTTEALREELLKVEQDAADRANHP